MLITHKEELAYSASFENIFTISTMSKISDSTLTKIKKFADDEEKDTENKFVEIIKKYFVETSIHGLKYIFESKRHFIERLFWFIACLFLWVFCFYLIYEVRKNNEIM